MKAEKKSIKKPQEIELIAEGGAHLARILRETVALVRPGISTWELNNFAESEIIKAGGTPSFLGYGDKTNPFPAGLCTSVNDGIVHGVPSKKDILKEGDIVGLDIGMKYKDLFTDHAVTVPVGKVSKDAHEIMEATRLALEAAIAQVKPGNKIGDIGFACEEVAGVYKFSVVKDLVGHGVGYAVHEPPQVPGYGRAGKGLILEENMVIAIEPMLCQRKADIWFDTDGWTIRTRDGGLAAHFEHTVVVTKTGVRILTE